MVEAPVTPSISTHHRRRPAPRCDRQLYPLENTHPSRAAFPACPGYPEDCAWTGIVPFSWSKPCAFCCEALPAGTTTWSRNLGGEFVQLLYTRYTRMRGCAVVVWRHHVRCWSRKLENCSLLLQHSLVCVCTWYIA